jgi:hypothetical protein
MVREHPPHRRRPCPHPTPTTSPCSTGAAGHIDYDSADQAARIFREIVATVLADDSAADAASPHSGRWAEADPGAFDPARPDTLQPITPVSDPAGNQSL